MIATNDLTITLTDAQRAEIASSGGVTVREVESQRDYVLVDAAWLREARRAVAEQADWEAVKEGLREARRGECVSLEEVDRTMRDELGIERE